MNPVPFEVLGVLMGIGTFLTVAYIAVHTICEVVNIRRRVRAMSDGEVVAEWRRQLPGLEEIPRCPECRVVEFGDQPSERVPCQWHADMASVAIERQVSQ